MLDLITLLPVIFAIVNASIPFGDTFVPVPLEVQPLGAQAPTTQAVSQGPIDFSGLTGLVTAIGGVLGAIGFKMYRDKKVEDRRDNLVAETSFKQVQSLQETDKGMMELADFTLQLAKKTGDATLISKAEQLAKQHCNEYKAYYEDIQPQPLDYDKDPVIKKLSAVQKRVEK